jgi:hypothetical protein
MGFASSPAREGNAMRLLRKSGPWIALGLIVAVARAGERPASSPAASASVVTLGPPVAASAAAGCAPDRRLRLAAYEPGAFDASPTVVRAQGMDPAAPGAAAPVPAPVVPPPPGVPSIPASPAERFNCGVVVDPPPSGALIEKGPKNWWGGVRDFCGGLVASDSTTPRARFQSDHGFDALISPVTNPFLFEDPRALTELRPVFMVQGAPSGNPAFRGGNLEYLGLQGRLAVTERLSFVWSEFGWLLLNPSSGGTLGSESGFAEIRLGPKYTFYRCEPGTVAAAGLTFDIPVGSSKVFQDTGSLSLVPYVSVGQNFGRSNFGSFNFLGTLGYSVATDSERTDYLFTSLHLDYDVGNLRKIYPLWELNYFHYSAAGNARPLDFEGRDLINFGSTGVGGHNTVSMAVGARYKISEVIQFGGAFEFPVSGNRDLLDYRVTLDMIYRY